MKFLTNSFNWASGNPDCTASAFNFWARISSRLAAAMIRLPGWCVAKRRRLLFGVTALLLCGGTALSHAQFAATSITILSELDGQIPPSINRALQPFVRRLSLSVDLHPDATNIQYTWYRLTALGGKAEPPPRSDVLANEYRITLWLGSFYRQTPSAEALKGYWDPKYTHIIASVTYLASINLFGVSGTVSLGTLPYDLRRMDSLPASTISVGLLRDRIQYGVDNFGLRDPNGLGFTTTLSLWANMASVTVGFQVRENATSPWRNIGGNLYAPRRGTHPEDHRPLTLETDLSYFLPHFSNIGGDYRLSVSIIADSGGYRGVNSYYSNPHRYYLPFESTITTQMPASHSSGRFTLRQGVSGYAAGEGVFGFMDPNGVGVSLHRFWRRQSSLALSWQRRRSTSEVWEEFLPLTLNPGLEADAAGNPQPPALLATDNAAITSYFTAPGGQIRLRVTLLSDGMGNTENVAISSEPVTYITPNEQRPLPKIVNPAGGSLSFTDGAVFSVSFQFDPAFEIDARQTTWAGIATDGASRQRAVAPLLTLSAAFGSGFGENTAWPQTHLSLRATVLILGNYPGETSGTQFDFSSIPLPMNAPPNSDNISVSIVFCRYRTYPR